MKSILAVFILLAVCAVPVGAGENTPKVETVPAGDGCNTCEKINGKIIGCTLMYCVTADEILADQIKKHEDDCLVIMEQAMREMDEYKIYGLGPTDERSNKAEQVWKHWQDAKRCWRKP